MKIKRSDVLAISGSLSGILELNLEPKAAYKIATNSILASELAEKISKIYKQVDGFDEFIEKKNKLLAELGATDMGNGNFSIKSEDAAMISVEVKRLTDEHRDVVDAQDAYDEKFNKLLEKKENVEFEKINMDELDAKIEPAKLIPLIQSGILTNGSDS